MRNILKLVAIPAISLGFVMLFSSVSFAQNSTSGDIKINPNSGQQPVKQQQPKESPKVYLDYSKPYKLDKGKRDPFVPFGGNAAPDSTLKQSKNNVKPTSEPVRTADGKVIKEKEVVSELPVRVTATMISGSSSYAILTAADGKSSSFMVKPGDKVGEYTVQSIYSDKVILVWGGKPYTVPVKGVEPAGKSSSKNTKTDGASNTLPVPKVEEDKPAHPIPTGAEQEKKVEDGSGQTGSQ